jgi:hypothetical protein
VQRRQNVKALQESFQTPGQPRPQLAAARSALYREAKSKMDYHREKLKKKKLQEIRDVYFEKISRIEIDRQLDGAIGGLELCGGKPIQFELRGCHSQPSTTLSRSFSRKNPHSDGCRLP